MKPLTISRAAMLAGILAFPLGASAQTATPAAPAPPAASATAGALPAATALIARHETQVEHRIADLHTKLHITQAQETAWSQFAQVMRDNARGMDQTYEQRSEHIGEMTAVDNMQSYAQLAEAHAQDVQKLVPAFQTLYDSISPQQKQAADKLFRNYAERSQEYGKGHHR